MGLLITGLTQVLLFHKFKLVKTSSHKILHVIVAAILTWAVTTVVIEVVFYAVLYQNFSDRRLQIIFNIVPYLAGFPVAGLFSFLFNMNLFEKKPTLHLILRSLVSTMLLTLQITSSFYFAVMI